ncbi:LysE/ArgO family amino acid transporter [Vogesella indigofera]|uniref:LysE/ArgO family amino acid transporter n=1 Tax=Vogesella indigofera TaxID=45465 RepID=UPI00234E9EEE|nr:LysE/ArgO family amino acid transporter [Vogesella indigofera]MDC7702025.1 LysE/ArgO family amino acid transporter [Vogesella indigofera]
MLTASYFKGLGLGASLIMAIGSQNAHVLKMGLLRQHVGVTVLVCMLCDAVLIAAGVAGMGSLIQRSPLLLEVARWGGAAFLFWYGLRAWRAVLADESLQIAAGATAMPLKAALLTVLALTLLNPHVYLDTVVLLGSIGGQEAGAGRLWFALGACTASMLWFAALGYGARLLAPLFARPLSWRVLDGVVGTVMWTLAGALALS